MNKIDLLSNIFIFTVGSISLFIMVLFVLDMIQTKDAVRRNFPVIGRFRSLFTTLGEFFRQYFFAMDREEMPFNRAEREWVDRATHEHDNTIAFGSTKSLTPVGTAIFVNCAFPTLDDDAVEMQPLEIGPYCRIPFHAPSFFNISGMSFGALSSPAVLALSKGAKLAGCWMNTGEGGLSPYHLLGGADIIMQIGTAKYGVRDQFGNLSDDKLKEIAAHEQVRMFEIKLSQGAKPGKGGILPAIKVTAEIAAIRSIPEGQDSISPNRHPEINDVGDLLDMIGRVRAVTGKPTGIKAVIGAYGWIEELCAEICIRGPESAPDFFTVDSGDGGTGAAPMALMDNVGLTIRESLPLVSDILHKYGLRERTRIVASGKLVTPSEVAWAIATGADFVVSARGFMFSLGCIQALKCNKNTCPTGITTHKAHLQKGLNPEEKSVKVANYCMNMIHEVQIISHSCGVSRPRLMGRKHVRIVQSDGKSVPMDRLYPRPDIIASPRALETPPS
ncbi:MAG: FMN-binding glutamate synthase family protein [Sphingomonadales bacterium]|nr:FMN-binding glutamate synthase family protein [Sphingomonadales bacterium]PIX65595.1 MAG: FMN-binding glutamate synthase family protein [Sphingomonadales bacterium CG_4_10_14_3_um_filter_58_15]NCO47496.1 FMN-binding glutamate synthase family protein [Sphingomonadales bacterium]NCO99002.1 FMN-binding glutamate synthase family protein [Sphingomonadales bacterium]NCP25671.1 FMN-binding glutamate synthase family protein [Sphingomonadales bacterium]